MLLGLESPFDKSFLGSDLVQRHQLAADSLNNLAGLLRDTNRMAEAEPLYRRALTIDEKSFGPEHPNVATGLNNLAGLISDTNRMAEAEPLYRRALAIDEKSFGPEHPEVAIRLNNLALLLRATNRMAEAEPLYRRAQTPGIEKKRASRNIERDFIAPNVYRKRALNTRFRVTMLLLSCGLDAKHLSEHKRS
jgi:tetratricopeptide (TPR) repeat protein